MQLLLYGIVGAPKTWQRWLAVDQDSTTSSTFRFGLLGTNDDKARHWMSPVRLLQAVLGSVCRDYPCQSPIDDSTWRLDPFGDHEGDARLGERLWRSLVALSECVVTRPCVSTSGKTSGVAVHLRSDVAVCLARDSDDLNRRWASRKKQKQPWMKSDRFCLEALQLVLQLSSELSSEVKMPPKLGECERIIGGIRTRIQQQSVVGMELREAFMDPVKRSTYLRARQIGVAL